MGITLKLELGDDLKFLLREVRDLLRTYTKQQTREMEAIRMAKAETLALIQSLKDTLVANTSATDSIKQLLLTQQAQFQQALDNADIDDSERTDLQGVLDGFKSNTDALVQAATQGTPAAGDGTGPAGAPAPAVAPVTV